jgi:serine/threonine protein kinase
MEVRLTGIWQEVFAAADRALELEPAERQAFIERCLRENPVLGAELKALLDGAAAASLFETPAAAFAGAFLQEALQNAHDDDHGEWPMFGPYRVRREIGRGGMGTVYLAERADDQYRKEVALKVLPPWGGRDQRRLQRFLDERQILAALDHPNIARLLDGGVTADGLSWFAMEYVDGQPIDAYCDRLRLSIEERLTLFCSVCSAVQYAHRNLVVHRDLKPSNILVTADGRVVLLDFGIAKLLGEHPTMTSAVTATDDRLLTPLYASPEQIRGEAPSTATDVYALGLLLHVLLTGKYAYRLSSRESYDVARAVLEQEPERPSVSAARDVASVAGGPSQSSAPERALARGSTPVKLARRLRGDLDAIVLKAMEKEPSRRYTTADQLETDVRRHLNGLPVIAQPQRRFYSARKFLGRHRVSVGISTAVALLVLTLAVVMTVQRSRIRAQEVRIASARNRTENTSQYLLNIIQTLSPGSRGPEPREILDSATALIERHLMADPEHRARLMFELAKVNHQLELNDRARRLLEISLTLRRALQPRPDLEIAETLHLLGAVLLAQDSLGPAEDAYSKALALRRQQRGARHGDVARTLVGLSSVFRAQRRLPEAEGLAREAVTIDESRGRDARADLAQSTSALARVFADNGDQQTAVALFGRALTLVRETHAKDDPDVAAAVFELAAALNRAGDHRRADSVYRDGFRLQRRLLYRGLLTGTGTPATTSQFAEITAPVESALALGSAPPKRASAGVAAKGSRIAFVTDRDGPDPIGNLGNQEIYVMNADGTDQRRLTQNNALDVSPAWSPDGSKIAFASEREGFDIYLMNADGTQQRRLTDFTERGLGAVQPAWSPDGTRIAFRSRDNEIDIWVINVDGTGLTNLTKHPRASGLPAWSPDGRRIAFNSNRDGNQEIYVMDADGRNVVRLTYNDSLDQHPAWSPDGSHIAFHSKRDGNQEIYVMKADGSDVVRLTNDPTEDGHPSWSPDGRRIVFHKRVLTHYQIYVMKADGSDVRRLTALSRIVVNGFPSWGPPPP